MRSPSTLPNFLLRETSDSGARSLSWKSPLWAVSAGKSLSGIKAVYVSPLRALTYDIQKNLNEPLQEMGLADRIRVERLYHEMYGSRVHA